MFRFSFESIWSGDDSLFYSTKKFIIIVIYIDHASSPWLPLSPFFSLTIPAMIIQQIPTEIRHKKVFWRKTSACRDGTLKNHPNKIGMTLQHFHTIPTSCSMTENNTHHRHGRHCYGNIHKSCELGGKSQRGREDKEYSLKLYTIRIALSQCITEMFTVLTIFDHIPTDLHNRCWDWGIYTI